MPLVTPESSTTAEHPRYGKPRNDNQNQHEPISKIDPNPPSIPCIIQSTRSKSTISSILLSSFSPTNDYSPSSITPKKKNFTSPKFRGMGCTASSQVSVPAAIRSSADWDEAKKVKKKKQRSKKNRAPVLAFDDNPSSSSSSSSLSLSSGCGVAVPSDVWCGPGIGGFNADVAADAFVDCVVSRS